MAVKRILLYLKGTLSFGLQFQSTSSLDLHGYSDADWASCPDDRSISGYCICLGSNIISWSSSKQRVVSKSSVESDITTLLPSLLNLYGFYLLSKNCLSIAPPTICCDNQSAAHLAHNPVFHSRAKHIEIGLHFIRKKVLCNELVIKYVPSQDQIADILTKHLSTAHYCNLHIKLSVISFPMSFRGDDNHLTSSQTSHNRSTKHPTNSVSVTTIQTNSPATSSL